MKAKRVVPLLALGVLVSTTMFCAPIPKPSATETTAAAKATEEGTEVTQSAPGVPADTAAPLTTLMPEATSMPIPEEEEKPAGDTGWLQCSEGMGGENHVMDLALSPDYVNDRTLFAGTYGNGVFKSTDGGASWSAVNTGLTDLYVRALAISPGYATDHTLFAATGAEYEFSGGVFKSTDGGASWSAIGLTDVLAQALALSPDYVNDRTIFAGTYGGGGIQRSTDDGASWSRASSGLTSTSAWEFAISPGYAADHTLFVGLEWKGVFKSTDAGDSWSATGLTGSGVSGLTLSPAYLSDHTLFAKTYRGVLLKSTDDGVTWSRSNPGPVGVHAFALSPDYASDQTLFVVQYNGEVFRSTDGAGSWVKCTGLGEIGSSVMSLVLIPTSPRTLLAGTYRSSVWRYTEPALPH